MVTVKDGKLVISSERDAYALESKMSHIQTNYLSFVVFTCTTIINQLIIDPIQNNMRRDGVSEKIIQTTVLDKKATHDNNTIIFHVISPYVTDKGFPVMKIIEHGRRAYIIRAKENRPNPHLKFIIDGIKYFRKKVNMPAKKAEHYIQNGIDKGQPKVQKELNRKTNRWIKDIIRSGA